MLLSNNPYMYFSISKASIWSSPSPRPTNLTGIKGQKLSDITLPDGFTWENENIELKIGKHTYKATYTPLDTTNYETVTGIDIEVDTLKAPVLETNTEITSNPKTFDNITIYMSIAVMSAIGLGTIALVRKRKDFIKIP